MGGCVRLEWLIACIALCSFTFSSVSEYVIHCVISPSINISTCFQFPSFYCSSNVMLLHLKMSDQFFFQEHFEGSDFTSEHEYFLLRVTFNPLHCTFLNLYWRVGVCEIWLVWGILNKCRLQDNGCVQLTETDFHYVCLTILLINPYSSVTSINFWLYCSCCIQVLKSHWSNILCYACSCTLNIVTSYCCYNNCHKIIEQ